MLPSFSATKKHHNYLVEEVQVTWLLLVSFVDSIFESIPAIDYVEYLHHKKAVVNKSETNALLSWYQGPLLLLAVGIVIIWLIDPV